MAAIGKYGTNNSKIASETNRDDYIDASILRPI